MSFKSMVQRMIEQQEGPQAPPTPVGAGITSPAVLTQVEEAVEQGGTLYETIRGILNPREAEARRSAELARRALEERSTTVPGPAVAGVSGVPLVIAGLVAAVLLARLKVR